MLEDTGAGDADVHGIVMNVVAKWLKMKKRQSIPLLVMHSHGHGDHTAGDPQLRDQPDVELIPATVPALQKAFGIKKWPEDIGHVDLGDRVLDVLPVPGHQAAAVALYDRKTGILLTGDNLYPGRLYISDWPAFAASTRRMVDFTSNRIVTHVLGTHVEQANRPFLDYPIGSIYQPDEHPLELSRAHLIELKEALRDHRDKPQRLAYRDFTLWPMTPEVQQEMRRTREETETKQRQNQWNQF
jgi:glyoxylase-like metal-dependent hydrolase (beta-lactamase superfamily II)